MADSVGKWAAGMAYGPVLSQTDLYLLQTELEVNPIFTQGDPEFHLLFNLLTGQTGGFNPAARDHDLDFTAKDQPATLPRVNQLIIITELSPWCTVIRNDQGVTLSDVCTTMWKEYTENFVTDAEYAALPSRLQEQIRRVAIHNSQMTQGNQWGFGTPAAVPNRFKRVDWLRERTFFDGLRKKDNYAISRLGFKAPNIFVMELGT